MSKKMDNDFNRRIYGKHVCKIATNRHDFRFLCNEMAKLYKKINDGCVDNARVGRIVSGKCDAKYSEKLKRGCCGFVDKRLLNDKTKNKFIIGFNFGH